MEACAVASDCVHCSDATTHDLRDLLFFRDPETNRLNYIHKDCHASRVNADKQRFQQVVTLVRHERKQGVDHYLELYATTEALHKALGSRLKKVTVTNDCLEFNFMPRALPTERDLPYPRLSFDWTDLAVSFTVYSLGPNGPDATVPDASLFNRNTLRQLYYPWTWWYTVVDNQRYLLTQVRPSDTAEQHLRQLLGLATLSELVPSLPSELERLRQLVWEQNAAIESVLRSRFPALKLERKRRLVDITPGSEGTYIVRYNMQTLPAHPREPVFIFHEVGRPGYKLSYFYTESDRRLRDPLPLTTGAVTKEYDGWSQSFVSLLVTEPGPVFAEEEEE